MRHRESRREMQVIPCKLASFALLSATRLPKRILLDQFGLWQWMATDCLLSGEHDSFCTGSDVGFRFPALDS